MDDRSPDEGWSNELGQALQQRVGWLRAMAWSAPAVGIRLKAHARQHTLFHRVAGPLQQTQPENAEPMTESTDE